jgi:hypothetical protein
LYEPVGSILACKLPSFRPWHLEPETRRASARCKLDPKTVKNETQTKTKKTENAKQKQPAAQNFSMHRQSQHTLPTICSTKTGGMAAVVAATLSVWRRKEGRKLTRQDGAYWLMQGLQRERHAPKNMQKNKQEST